MSKTLLSCIEKDSIDMEENALPIRSEAFSSSPSFPLKGIVGAYKYLKTPYYSPTKRELSPNFIYTAESAREAALSIHSPGFMPNCF